MRVLRKFQHIQCFIFDVDGVMTNGRLIAQSHDFDRSFNLKDGFAIRQAIKAGYQLAVISGATSKGVEERLKYLGIKHIYLGVSDKLSVYRSYATKFDQNPAHILFMGDDLPDIPLMKEAGLLSCCPKDASPEIIEMADYISSRKGGDECVRDVIEKVMRLQDKWIFS